MQRVYTLLSLFTLIGICVCMSAWAKTETSAEALFSEALGIQEKARSKEQLKQALSTYNKALKLFEDRGKKKRSAEVFNQIGDIYYIWSDYRKALEFYKKAFKFSEEATDVHVTCLSLNNRGKAYFRLGEYQKAKELCQKALAKAESISDRSSQAKSRYQIGKIHSSTGNSKEAMVFFQKALPISKQVGDVRTECALLLGIRRDPSRPRPTKGSDWISISVPLNSVGKPDGPWVRQRAIGTSVVSI